MSTDFAGPSETPHPLAYTEDNGVFTMSVCHLPTWLGSGLAISIVAFDLIRHESWHWGYDLFGYILPMRFLSFPLVVFNEMWLIERKRISARSRTLTPSSWLRPREDIALSKTVSAFLFSLFRFTIKPQAYIALSSTSPSKLCKFLPLLEMNYIVLLVSSYTPIPRSTSNLHNTLKQQNK